MIRPKIPPYASTEIDPDDTRGEIDKLLRSYGVQKIVWATDYSTNDVRLMFDVEVEIEGIKKTINVLIQPPLILKKTKIYNAKRGITEQQNIPNWPQSMRIMFWYIKSKLEAVSYGLVSAEQEFLSQVMYRLGDGSTETVGESMKRLIADNGLAKLPALEDKDTPTERVINAKSVEVVVE